MTSNHLQNLQKIGQLDVVPFSDELLHTLGVSDQTVRILDSLRKQRNSTDYDGDLVTETSLDECLMQAKALLAMAEQKLA